MENRKNIAIQALKDELSDVRRTGGLIDMKVYIRTPLLFAIFGDPLDHTAIEDSIKKHLLKPEHVKILFNALNTPSYFSPEDLTFRREKLAKEVGVSVRTMSRYEDMAIDSVAHGIVNDSWDKIANLDLEQKVDLTTYGFSAPRSQNLEELVTLPSDVKSCLQLLTDEKQIVDELHQRLKESELRSEHIMAHIRTLMYGSTP